jgi:peroxiredoxin
MKTEDKKRFNPFLTLALLSPLLAGSLAAQDQQAVEDFGLIDHTGLFHQLTKYGHKKAVVLVTQANGSNYIATQLPRFRALLRQWAPQDVAFFMLNSSAEDTRDSVRVEADVYDIPYPILLDTHQLVAERLNITAVGEVLVLDPTTMTKVYQGPLSQPRARGARARAAAAAANPDAPPPPPPPPSLTSVLAKVVAGEAGTMDSVIIPASAAMAQIAFATRDMHTTNPPDYATDVAPILQANCVTCHQEGGIGPFAMDSYRSVRGWSAMMRETMMTKRMPPAQVDPSIGHFTNARYLAGEDLQTLVHWMDMGAPRGGGGDPLAENPPVTEEGPMWELGEPDYIVTMEEPQEVPATGVLPYRNVNIEVPFEEDRWVKAVQFIPGDKKVLHHLLSYVIPPEYNSNNDGTAQTQRRFLEGYAPGKTEAQVFPMNAGVYIPKGFRIRFSLHYTTYGKETVDDTILGLYFHDTPPDHEFLNKSVTQSVLAIPPGDNEYQASQQFVFDQDIVLYGMRPHMHYRGKYFTFKVIYPDNTVEELLSVPNYNFAWQPTYRMAEPRAIPAGSRVVINGAFDNSEYNLGNPDPSKRITWGSQSWDEMFIGYFAYHNAAKVNGGDDKDKK